MATAEQIKALIRSHGSDDTERFYALALQVAAHEAQQGHGALAHEIRAIVDNARLDRRQAAAGPFPPDLEGYVQLDLPCAPLASLVLPGPLTRRIERVTLEFRQREKLKQQPKE